MRPNVEKYLVVIAGPTAVGKTQTAIALAQRYSSVIVSADSRQVFREMHIGTARPTPEEQAAIPHYLIGHVSLGEEYSAGTYARDCLTLLESLFTQHDLVFLTGGSGLYLRAVLEGFDEMPTVPVEVREKWTTVFQVKGLEALQQALQARDPDYTRGVDMQNPHRLIRALSVMDVAAKPFSELRMQQRTELPFQIIRILCNLSREELYARIHHRVDDMLKAGLLEEVRSLLPYRHTQAMQTVGYRELMDYLDGTCTLEEAVLRIKQHTSNYAKRQLTWFRHQGDWREFNPPDGEQIERYIESVILEGRRAEGLKG